MESKETSIISLLDAYRYLFYRIYLWQLNMFGEQEGPRFTALIGNSIFIGINLITLAVLFQIITRYTFRIESVYVIIGMLMIYSINYFLLLYRNKSRALIEKFSAESEIQRKRRTIYCWIYVLSTHIFFLASVVILDPRSKL